jgi:prepilin-type N-terminal cleavage/methylation domain-containing protein
MTQNRKTEQGFSLVELMIAIGVASIVTLGVSTVVSTALKSSSSLQSGVDKQALARFMLESVSCADTMPNGTCTPNQTVTVYRRSKVGALSTIATATNPGTIYDGYTVRADCDSTGNGLIFRATKLSSSGNLTSTSAIDFALDAFNQSIVKWTDSKSLLYPANVQLCTAGNTMPMRTEMHQDLADLCTVAEVHDHLCSGLTYKDVTFATPFTTPPDVIVSVVNVCDSIRTPCSGGTTDSYYIKADLVTTTGFRMYCNGSPRTGFCGAEASFHCGGTCNWMAAGH